MSELENAYRALLAAHERIGSPVPKYMRPGRPAAQVRSALASLELDPASDLVEYFTLHDGLNQDRWMAEHPELADISLFPFYETLGLDEALGRYGIHRQVSVSLNGPEQRVGRDLREMAYWARTWFPLFHGEYSLAADCRGGADSVVWGQDFHPGDPTAPLFESIAALLDEARTQFELGTLTWRSDWQAFDADDQALMARDRELTHDIADLLTARLDPEMLY
jgi:cell wall assembly regulator SMI1